MRYLFLLLVFSCARPYQPVAEFNTVPADGYNMIYLDSDSITYLGFKSGTMHSGSGNLYYGGDGYWHCITSKDTIKPEVGDEGDDPWGPDRNKKVREGIKNARAYWKHYDDSVNKKGNRITHRKMMSRIDTVDLSEYIPQLEKLKDLTPEDQGLKLLPGSMLPDNGFDPMPMYIPQMFGAYIKPHADTVQGKLLYSGDNDAVPYIIKGYFTRWTGTFLDSKPDPEYFDENKIKIKKGYVWGCREFQWKPTWSNKKLIIKPIWGKNWRDTIMVSSGSYSPTLISSNSVGVRYDTICQPFASNNPKWEAIDLGVKAYCYRIPKEVCDTFYFIIDKTGRGHRRMWITCPGQATIQKDTFMMIKVDPKTHKQYLPDGRPFIIPTSAVIIYDTCYVPGPSSLTHMIITQRGYEEWIKPETKPCNIVLKYEGNYGKAYFPDGCEAIQDKNGHYIKLPKDAYTNTK